MTLNPTLKSILVRTAYIVGSLTIYYIAYNYCLDYLDFHYWSDGGLIDGHPTLRYTLLMMAAAILIWVNIRKLSRPNIRLYFSAFLLRAWTIDWSMESRCILSLLRTCTFAPYISGNTLSFWMV